MKIFDPKYIRCGTIVKITNLKSRNDLNERNGLIMKYISEKDRQQVQIQDTGENISIRMANLELNDTLQSKIVNNESFLSCEYCNIFTEQLKSQQKLSNSKNFNVQNELLNAEKLSHTFFIDLTGFGHHFVLDLHKVIMPNCGNCHSCINNIENPDNIEKHQTIYQRIFQCWVKNKDNSGNISGQTLQEQINNSINYSINPERPGWMPKREPDQQQYQTFKWYDQNDLKSLNSKIEQLKFCINNLVNDQLLERAKQFVPSGDITQIRAWASEMKISSVGGVFNMKPTQGVGLTLQPGQAELVEKQTEQMKKQGQPAHAVLFHGKVEDPVQLLDFPVEYLQNLMILTDSLFQTIISPATLLLCLEWWNDEKDWSVQIVEREINK